MSNAQSHKQPPISSARKAMVQQQLVARGISDPAVLQAMQEVPRERFVPESIRDAACDDRALPVGNGQTISQPYIVAYMTEKLQVRPGHRVLEIGTGTGYQTAILHRVGAEVYSIERIAHLHESARQRLADLGFGPVHLRCGDGTLGWPEHAPYDRIIVTAGAPETPASLVEQLAEAGRIVIPIGRRDYQVLVCVEKREGRTVETTLVPCRFVGLIGQQGWPQAEH